jgi:hypothetical protein
VSTGVHPCVFSFVSSERTLVRWISQYDVENEGRGSRSASGNVKRREAGCGGPSGRRESGPVNVPGAAAAISLILHTREKQVGYCIIDIISPA